MRPKWLYFRKFLLTDINNNKILICQDCHHFLFQFEAWEEPIVAVLVGLNFLVDFYKQVFAPRMSYCSLPLSLHDHHVMCAMTHFLFFFKPPHPFIGQFEGSESLSNSNLCQRSRPSSEANNSSSQSPAHSKVTRSISANQKQRRFSDHGKDNIFDHLETQTRF